MDVEKLFHHTDAFIRIHCHTEGRERPKRLFYNKLLRILLKNRFVILTGLRGVGKTVLTLQVAKELRKEHGDRIVYINTDFFPDLDDAVSTFLEYHGFKNIESVDQDLYILIDEVHQYQGWNTLLKRLYDGSDKLYILVTGSSALHILASPDVLRRAAKLRLPPLFFTEYLLIRAFKEGKKLDKAVYKVFGKTTQELFVDYLLTGGFPFFTGDREIDYDKIVEVVNRVVWQDLSNLTHVSPLFFRFLKYLARNVPGPLSYEKISKMLGISKTTVERYINYLTLAGLVKRVEPCSLGRPLKPYKYYFTSPSLVSALDYIVPPLDDRGKGVLLETYVSTLLDSTCYHNADFDWKGRKVEVGWKKRKKKDSLIVSVEGDGIRPWELEQKLLEVELLHSLGNGLLRKVLNT